MNLQHLQNEKTVDEIINRLSGAHGTECKKTVEEVRTLKNEVDLLSQ
jgi:hypothetical protein